MVLVEVSQIGVGFVQVSQGWIGGEVQIRFKSAQAVMRSIGPQGE